MHIQVFEMGAAKALVLDVGGHTKGHIAFHFAQHESDPALYPPSPHPLPLIYAFSESEWLTFQEDLDHTTTFHFGASLCPVVSL